MLLVLAAIRGIAKLERIVQLRGTVGETRLAGPGAEPGGHQITRGRVLVKVSEVKISWVECRDHESWWFGMIARHGETYAVGGRD
jgi:hypothetical protein